MILSSELLDHMNVSIDVNKPPTALTFHVESSRGNEMTDDVKTDSKRMSSSRINPGGSTSKIH